GRSVAPADAEPPREAAGQGVGMERGGPGPRPAGRLSLWQWPTLPQVLHAALVARHGVRGRCSSGRAGRRGEGDGSRGQMAVQDAVEGCRGRSGSAWRAEGRGDASEETRSLILSP